MAYRAALVALFTTLAFAPKVCASMPTSSVEPTAAASAPTAIGAIATTPPIWSPPDIPGDGGIATPPPLVNLELLKARAAAESKDFKKVRSILEKRVLRGKGSSEEFQLLSRACAQLKDRACVEAVRAKHAEELTDSP